MKSYPILFFTLVILALASCSPSATLTQTPDSRAIETKIAANIFATQTASAPTPVLTATLQVTALPSAMWVCADLAFGYEQPSTSSRTVWQMAARDGWRFKTDGVKSVAGWVSMKLDDGRSAYMRLADLCDKNPIVAQPPQQPTPCPPNNDLCFLGTYVATPTNAEAARFSNCIKASEASRYIGKILCVEGVIVHASSEPNYRHADLSGLSVTEAIRGDLGGGPSGFTEGTCMRFYGGIALSAYGQPIMSVLGSETCR